MALKLNLWLVPFLLTCPVFGKSIFVDQKIPVKYCNNYNIEARDSSGLQVSCFKDIQSAVRSSDYGDTILIRAGFYPESVVINLSSDKKGYLILRNYLEEEVMIDGNNPATGPLISIACDRIRLSGLHISHSSTFGIISRKTSDIIIRDCEVSYSSDGGIVFVDASQIHVSRCYVHHNNYRGLSAAHEGISMHNVHTFEICDCTVHDNKEEGIDAKYGSQNGHIHHNTVYRNNGPNIYIDKANRIDIYNNKVFDAVTKAGISMNIESAWHTTGLAWTLEYVNIYNNIIYGNSGGIGFWLEPGNGEEKQAMWDHINIINNTIVDNSRQGEDRGGGIYVLNPEPENFGDHIVIRNNIFSGNTNEISKSIWDRYAKGQTKKFIIEHNLFIKTEPSDEYGTNPVVVDVPGFRDPGIADYSLLPGSPAIDMGIRTGIPETDFTDGARSVGNGPDIGAYEVGSTGL